MSENTTLSIIDRLKNKIKLFWNTCQDISKCVLVKMNESDKKNENKLVW